MEGGEGGETVHVCQEGRIGSGAGGERCRFWGRGRAGLGVCEGGPGRDGQIGAGEGTGRPGDGMAG